MAGQRLFEQSRERFSIRGGGLQVGHKNLIVHGSLCHAGRNGRLKGPDR
ncbi:hypothetical protein L810_4981 [Burkholderia sp. AU4i]|nr:hypothetical protein L810_4981 [Burkholderia sp. AU4i]MDW9226833.1 hypothetical protein [Burkholderia cepacia]MDW9245018.1 hypothetical protein [Burkholderia cepacia]QOH32373.1 hypothetical protein C7S14_4058 [Burkholderia cepacia]